MQVPTEQRPMLLTLISGALVVIGAMTIAANLAALVSIRVGGVWAIAIGLLAGLSALISGLLLRRRRPGARWLYVLWVAAGLSMSIAMVPDLVTNMYALPGVLWTLAFFSLGLWYIWKNTS